MGNVDKVLVEKEKLFKFVEDFQNEHEIEIPEWKDINNGKLKIKGASLNDHHTAKTIKSTMVMITNYLLSCIKEKKDVDPEVLKTFNDNGEMDPDACFEIGIFQRCVIDPEFSVDEVVKLSEVFPEVINRVVKRCLKMTKWENEDGNRKKC